MSAATIRRLRPDDAASFRAIRLEAVKVDPEALGSTFELEDKLDVAWFARRLENSPVMGAFQDGKLVGTAGFSIQPGQKNAHKGRLWGMYVRFKLKKARHRETFVVRRAGRLAQRECRINPVERRHRKTSCARGLYESAGFVEFGIELKAAKHGDKYYDEAHMALDFRG